MSEFDEFWKSAKKSKKFDLLKALRLVGYPN